jgi:hypothetical protein
MGVEMFNWLWAYEDDLVSTTYGHTMLGVPTTLWHYRSRRVFRPWRWIKKVLR